MKVVVPHNTTREEARRIIEQRVDSLMRQFGVQSGTIEQEWVGDTLQVKGKAHGIHVKGSVEVSDAEVAIHGDLPLLAKPFEPKIREAVEREAEQIFRKA